MTLALLLACFGSKDPVDPPDSELEADTDTDTDSDSDADGDSDADSDADTDPGGWDGDWTGSSGLDVLEWGFASNEDHCDVVLEVVIDHQASPRIQGSGRCVLASLGRDYPVTLEAGLAGDHATGTLYVEAAEATVSSPWSADFSEGGASGPVAGEWSNGSAGFSFEGSLVLAR